MESFERICSKGVFVGFFAFPTSTILKGGRRMLIRIAAVVTAYYLGRCGISIDELFKVLQVMLERHDRHKK